MVHRLWFLKTITGCALLWGVGFAFPAQIWAASSHKAALQSAQRLYQQKQWSQAAATAQRAVAAPDASSDKASTAGLYVILGASLYHSKQPVLAWSAFERALLWSRKATLPADADAGMKKLFASAQKQVRSRLGLSDGAKDATRPPPRRPPVSAAASQRPHIGWILGWVSVGLTGAALGLAAVSGGNAYINAQEASNLLREARREGYSQALMDPIISSVHERAATYGTVANVSYAVAGATALGATGFFLWAFFGSKQAPSPQASSPRSVLLQPMVRSPQAGRVILDVR